MILGTHLISLQTKSQYFIYRFFHRNKHNFNFFLTAQNRLSLNLLENLNLWVTTCNDRIMDFIVIEDRVFWNSQPNVLLWASSFKVIGLINLWRFTINPGLITKDFSFNTVLPIVFSHFILSASSLPLFWFQHRLDCKEN